MVNGVGRVAVKFRAAQPETLCGADHPRAAFSGSGGIGNTHNLAESWELGKSVTEREVLFDAIDVCGMHRHGAPERTAAFGNLRLRQMASSGARAQNLSTRCDLEAFGHRFFCLDAFGTSHKSAFSKKSA
jgi:3-phosphoglycerate kinase